MDSLLTEPLFAEDELPPHPTIRHTIRQTKPIKKERITLYSNQFIGYLTLTCKETRKTGWIESIGKDSPNTPQEVNPSTESG